MIAINRPKILIVEDNIVHYNVLVDCLGEEHYEFIHAITPDQGWEIAHSEHPDIVLLDVILSGDMDAGFHLCRRLKEDSATKDIPVLIVSRRTLDHDVNEIKEVGANGIVFKPYSPALVRKAVTELLRG